MSMKIVIRIGERQHTFLLHGEEFCNTLADVKEFCYRRFPHLANEKELKMYWNDLDGDDICIVTDGDYRSFMIATEKEKRRLYVDGTEAPQVDASVCPEPTNLDRPMHTLVICDVCDQDIVGHRYRCLTCHNYDLCMKCEAKYWHKDHVMLRIPRPPINFSPEKQRLYANMEHYARQLKLSPVPPRQKTDDGDVGGGNGNRANDVPAPNQTPRAESNHQPTTNQRGRCAGKRGLSAMHKANAAAAAIVHDRAQARFREVLSRYVDPANIDGTVETPSSSSANVEANVAAPPSAPSTANEEVLTEAQRSLKLAQEAAKVASAAAAASWNTFMGCAGMFVPVLDPSPSSSTATTGPTENQNAAPKQGTSAPTNGGAGSNASVVSGLVDEVLKYTPPEFKEFLPNEDEMNRLGDKLSTLLSQLGIELNMPASETEAAASSSSSVASNSDAPKETSDDQQGAGTQGTEELVLKATAVANEQEPTAQSSQTVLETDGVAVGASVVGKASAAEQTTRLVETGEEYSADTSSASLLTDDDEDVLEAAHISEQSNPPVASTSAGTVPWILVDLPDDREEEVKDKASSATSTSKPVESATPAAAAPGKGDDSMEIEKPQGDAEEFDESALLDLIEYTKERLAMLKKKSPKDKKVTQDDSLKTIFEKVTKELEKIENDRDVPMEEERKRQVEQGDERAASVSEPLNAKKVTQPVTVSPASSSTTSAPSTSASARNAAIPVPPSSHPPAASPFRTYSRRPHVNHAIHTMMTMGFSNNDGHLTQLLESLDGDIPRALDLLMQKLS